MKFVVIAIFDLPIQFQEIAAEDKG